MLFAFASPAFAEPTASAHPVRSPCIQAAFDAELETGVPIGLLLAVGRIESGRADPSTGHVAPWPWTINIGGEGRFFQTKEEALAFVRNEQSMGAQSIDVGCFQVNLYYHPHAFVSLEEAFDPAANARYAAHFLKELQARGGDWPSAVGLYHSAVPEKGGWYRDRVLASWNGGDLVVAPRLRASFAARPRMGDPYVVLITTAAAGVQVWTPQAIAAARATAAGPLPDAKSDPAQRKPRMQLIARTMMPVPGARMPSALPRVIVP